MFTSLPILKFKHRPSVETMLARLLCVDIAQAFTRHIQAARGLMLSHHVPANINVSYRDNCKQQHCCQNARLTVLGHVQGQGQASRITHLKFNCIPSLLRQLRHLPNDCLSADRLPYPRKLATGLRHNHPGLPVLKVVSPYFSHHVIHIWLTLIN